MNARMPECQNAGQLASQLEWHRTAEYRYNTSSRYLLIMKARSAESKGKNKKGTKKHLQEL